MAQKGECPLGLLCEHSVDGSRDYSDQSQRAREGDCGTDQGSWDGSVIRAHQAVVPYPTITAASTAIARTRNTAAGLDTARPPHWPGAEEAEPGTSRR